MQEKKLTRAKKVIEALRNHYGEKVGEFAARLGVGASTVSTWANRDSLDEDLIFRKCEGVKYEFLLTGEGPMFDTEAAPAAPGEKPAGTVAEQLAGYSPAVRIAADYMELKTRGLSEAERLRLVEELMEKLREAIK